MYLFIYLFILLTPCYPQCWRTAEPQFPRYRPCPCSPTLPSPLFLCIYLFIYLCIYLFIYLFYSRHAIHSAGEQPNPNFPGIDPALVAQLSPLPSSSVFIYLFIYVFIYLFIYFTHAMLSTVLANSRIPISPV